MADTAAGRPTSGVALAPASSAGAEELIRRADMAMYRSKRAGKGRVTADRVAGGAS